MYCKINESIVTYYLTIECSVAGHQRAALFVSAISHEKGSKPHSVGR